MRTFIFGVLLRPLVTLLTAARIEGRLNIPQSGPAILAANHNSHLDTILILCLLPPSALRLVRPVAAADHFIKSPFSSWFYRQFFGVVTVRRRCLNRNSENVCGLRECLTALSRNEILLIYPEGTRGDSEAMGPLKNGIARLSQAFPEAPVIPVYIRGTREVLPKNACVPRPGPCAVTFGGAFAWAGSRRAFMTTLRARFGQLQSDPKPVSQV